MTRRNRQERLDVSSPDWPDRPDWPDPDRRSRARLVLTGVGVLIAILFALLCASAVGEAAGREGAEQSAPSDGSTRQRC
jgi:hypothetical protein